ncbi:multidrug resistance efflux pump [Amorphus suaedae]
MTPPGTPADPHAADHVRAGEEASAAEVGANTPETRAEETSTAEAELDRVRQELEAIDASRGSGFIGSLMGALGARSGARSPREPGTATRPDPAPPTPAANAAPEDLAPPPPTDPGRGVDPVSPVPERSAWAGSPRVEDAASRRLAYRLATPARFETEGESFRTLDWSLGGFALPAGSGGFRPGQRASGTFTVFLDQFVVSTEVRAEVVYADARRLGFRFTDLSNAQIRMLRSLAGALLSGQVPLTIGIGEGARRHRTHQARGLGRGRPPRFVRLFSSLLNGAMVLVVLGIGMFMFFTPIEPSFTAETGAVAAPQITVAAPAGGAVAGVVSKKGDEVVPGTRLASIESTAGDRIALESPCYCVIYAIAEAGSSVAAGAPVVQLYASTVVPTVQAVFSSERADELGPGRMVEIRLPYSGRTVTGRIERVTTGLEANWIGVPVTLANGPGRLVAWIEPTPPLPPTAIGEPVVVTFQPSTGL